jgi:hypothetical protein
MLEMGVLEGLLPEMSQLSSNSNCVPDLSAIQDFLTQLIDVIVDLVNVDAELMIKCFDANCEVSPDLLALGFAKVFIVERKLYTRLECLVD